MAKSKVQSPESEQMPQKVKRFFKRRAEIKLGRIFYPEGGARFEEVAGTPSFHDTKDAITWAQKNVGEELDVRFAVIAVTRIFSFRKDTKIKIVIAEIE